MSEAFKYQNEVFAGPLDLLLSLIQKNKVSIYDIPIADILDQYLDYLEAMRNEGVTISAEFIVMASELLYVKSKMLLPREEDEEDPREGLVNALIEYQKMKVAAEFFSERYEKYCQRFNSPSAPAIITKVVKQYDVSELYAIMDYLKTARRDKREYDKRETLGTILKLPVVTIEEKIIFVLRVLVKSISFDRPVKFNSLFAKSPSRSDKVACFLAVLELVKSGRISVSHDGDDDYRITLNREKKEEESNGEVL
ncbi:MAG: segregation/condensation protein A [Clostridia bacterium]|nr:segregation/condensation protein A [Clostridia bacterium]